MSEPFAAGGEGFAARAARHAGLPYRALDADPPDPAAALLLSPWAARRYGVVPVAVEAGVLVLAVADPSDEDGPQAVESLTGLPVRVVVASAEAIARAHAAAYGPRAVAGGRAATAPVSAAELETAASVAAAAGLPFARLEPQAGFDPVNPSVAQLVSEDVCRRLRLIPVSVAGGVVTVAVAEPFAAVESIAAALVRSPVRVVVAPAAEVDRAVERVFAALARSRASSLEARPRERRRRLGEILVAAGLITSAQLLEALRIQERVGGRIGEVLLHAGLIDEHGLSSTIAAQLRLPLVDLARLTPQPEALALLPEPVVRRLRAVPLAVEGHVLHLAVADPLDDEALRSLRVHTRLPVRTVVAPRRAVEKLIQETYASRYTRVATAELLNRSPEESAYRTLSRPQKVVFAVLAVGFVLFLAWDPIATLIAFNIGSIVFYGGFSLYKFRLIYDALGHDLELPVSDEEVAALDERTLPVYTVLVPLYRESTVAERIVRAIAALDYPRSKLDVKLIVEEDDAETRDALARADLPPHFRLVVVPDSVPKTKPKACNYGLIQAEGKYVVIYDAEDRPEPDQLKKAVIAFSKAEERIVCIQCKLNYYNRNQNLLTRWFTSEYSSWFDLFMPGLDAADSPIPLGGTSNHILREKLIELGAWDPFNVTEDADLGIRLHKAGYKTAIIDSTTFEEANSDLYNWIRQRSRWVKGYIQTWLVHMRHPLQLWRQLGPRGFVSFQFVVGGTFFSFLLNPFYWVLTTLWLMTHAGVIRSLFPSFVYYAAALGLYIGNFVFTYVNVAGIIRRGYYDLVKYALLSPLYWGLMSIGAWKGLLQLIYRPFYWEKTVHGLDEGVGDRVIVV